MNVETRSLGYFSINCILVGLKSILIKTETIKLAIPSIRQIRNSKLIENDFNNKIPKKGPMADPRTRLSENKLMPSLLRSTGVTCRDNCTCSCRCDSCSNSI